MGGRAGQRMAYAHLPRWPAPRRHEQVAAANNGEAPVALELSTDEVGRPSLDRAGQVELEAGRPADHPRGVVDLHRAPSGRRVGPRRPAWRRHPPAPTAARRARRARVTRGTRRDAAHPRASGPRGRRSATPYAARPRPPLAAARRRAPRPADPRSAATGRCRRQSATGAGRSRPAATARRSRRPRRARPARRCPSSGSCRRAPVSAPAASAFLGAARGRRRHFGAVLLLQIRNLPRAGRGRHRWRWLRCRAPAVNEVAHAGARGGQLPERLCEPSARRHSASLRPPGRCRAIIHHPSDLLARGPGCRPQPDRSPAQGLRMRRARTDHPTRCRGFRLSCLPGCPAVARLTCRFRR